jgi:hypothetical protein
VGLVGAVQHIESIAVFKILRIFFEALWSSWIDHQRLKIRQVMEEIETVLVESIGEFEEVNYLEVKQ